MFNFYHYYLYLLLQFGTSQKCSKVTLPLSEGKPSRSGQFKTQVSARSPAQEPGPCPGQEAELWVLSMLRREPAGSLRSVPCGPGEGSPLGQSPTSRRVSPVTLPRPDARATGMHVPAPARVERPSPSQTTSAAITSLPLAGG